MIKPIWIAAGIFFYIACLFYESYHPLRKPTQPKLPRIFKNLTLGAIGSGTLRLGFYSSLLAFSQMVLDRHWGLLCWLSPSPVLRILLAFLLLDYTLYFWHMLNHKIPFLWRFHSAHHADLDMDISTAARFHFGELMLSVIPRSLEIIVLGLDPWSIVFFDSAALVAVHFHHSNMKLPMRLEKALNWFFVTPRMHGIHHSIVREETDSNFSTVFLFWDRLHRTLKLDIDQSEVTIGVPAYRDPKELTLWKTLWLPFQRTRPWALLDGTIPVRN